MTRCNLSSFTRVSPAADAALKASFPRPLSAFPWGEQIRNREIVHIPDVEVEWAEVPSLREMARLRGFRGVLIVPLLRDRAPIGVVTVSRAEPGIFAAHHVELPSDFCRSGRHRHRECAAIRRGTGENERSQRGATAADRYRRRAQGDQPLGVRS